ncbi:MAG: zf-HC2 domain-containing protein [Spirochaetes bacterium]|nr:zf-HC2 domain-containing protein [Spirochaetota bacterium]
MNTHLKDKDIDRLVSGMMTRRESLRVQRHIDKCDSCRKNVNILSGILSTQINKSVPGENVKAAILAEWHRMNSNVVIKQARGAFTLRLVYGLAAVLFIVISAYLALIRVPLFNYNDGLTGTSISGEVYVNNTAADIDRTLHKGDVVATGTDSSVNFTAESYSLSIESSSELKLAESNNETGFLFILNRGAVTSRSEGKIKYAFTCGSYRIVPAGTEFRIEMSGRNIELSVLSGMIIVSGAGLKIEVPAGMKWDSADPGNIRSADAGNINNNQTDMNGRVQGSGEYKVKDKVQDSGPGMKRYNDSDHDEIRDLKRESREIIKDMKKENRNNRQTRKGN